MGQCLNGIIPNIYKGQMSGEFLIKGQAAFDMSIYDKSHLVSTVLQDTDGQFIGLSVAEDLAFALENDVTDLEEMKAVFINGLKARSYFFTVSASSGFVRWTKAAGQSGWCLD